MRNDDERGVTGTDVLRAALSRLNYTDAAGEVDNDLDRDLIRRGSDAVNYILVDLQHVTGEEARPVRSMLEPLPISRDAALRVMPWGVAMMLAQGEGDGDNQQYMASMYNQLRSSVKKPAERVENRVPYPVY